jgi:hypothetical protein
MESGTRTIPPFMAEVKTFLMPIGSKTGVADGQPPRVKLFFSLNDRGYPRDLENHQNAEVQPCIAVTVEMN